MNINKIIILIIILLIINSLSNGNIIAKIKEILSSYSLLNKKSKNLSLSINKYKHTNENNLQLFMSNLINNNNTKFTILKKKNLEANSEIINKLWKYISTTFNCSNYKFTNIQIIDSIYYNLYNEGSVFEPFRIKTDVIFNNKNLGKYILLIECCYDNVNNYFVFNKIKILIHEYPNNKFNNKLNNIFIKSNDNDNNNDNNNNDNNDTDNSLIPSNIELSANEYEVSSE